MATYKQLKRLERIIYLLKRCSGISKAQLMETLWNDYGIETSSRTLERDLKTLKDEFLLDIEYDHQEQGYVLEDDEERVGRFLNFAEFASLAELYEEGLVNYEQFQKWVIPDDNSRFKGLQHLRKLLHAIAQGRKVQFMKENYHENTEKMYVVSPLRLKEYLNRWYLIAVADGESDIRNFGIDRLSSLTMLETPASRPADFEKQLAQYDDVVGLNFSESENEHPETVVLRAHNNQIKYLKSLPLHASQVCVMSVEGDWGRVTYKLKPNYEFITQLLRMADMVEVQEPQWLRERIKGYIGRMAALYIAT
ncbi:MAG: hypothetical protein CMC08_06745 [Flavobacteriaceae bacterium]|nr:hypothetical protein [Flavobacteriaceae bacterium]